MSLCDFIPDDICRTTATENIVNMRKQTKQSCVSPFFLLPPVQNNEPFSPPDSRRLLMLTKTNVRWTVSLALLGMTTFVAGCADNTDTTQVAQNDAHGEHADHDDDRDEHSGWWCGEHGVPEEECTRCNSTLVAGFKDKGDWCDEHDLPDSQCFKCDPKRAETFIARYEAKFGEKPPAPTE